MRAPYDAMMYQYRTHVRVYPRRRLRHQSTKERHASSAHLGPAHRKASQRISHARRPALHARAHPRHHPHTQNRRPAHRGRYLRPVRPRAQTRWHASTGSYPPSQRRAPHASPSRATTIRPSAWPTHRTCSRKTASIFRRHTTAKSRTSPSKTSTAPSYSGFFPS